jgi:hypothetical protein
MPEAQEEEEEEEGEEEEQVQVLRNRLSHTQKQTQFACFISLLALLAFLAQKYKH